MIDNWVIHPAADLFPLIEGDEFAQLVDDIRVNGLLEPVWVLPNGSLLDGRNRVRACVRAGVEVVSRVYEGDDPVGFVLSLNVQRRHLSTGQRAMLALRVEELIAETNRPGRPWEEKVIVAERRELERDRKSSERAAVAVGTSGRAVSRAKRVAQEAPDLADKVRSGEIALDRAERIVRDREAAERRIAEAQEQRQHIEQGTTVRIEHGDFREVLADLRNVDAIITDPPYPAEFVPLLDDLRDFADKVLAPDGVLVVLFGQTYLPEVFRRLEGGRPYRWTGAFMTPGAGYASMARRVQSNWKPVLVYGGGERFGDVFQSEGKDAHAKDLHHWGQDYGGFHQLVERLTKPGQTVVDPFMGSGTTLLAAQALGRHAIGCDIDVEHVGTAARRLGV
jgi:hypothetical protein